MRSYDVVVVGAGIVGLAVARELLIRYPQGDLGILDKEPNIGQHQTATTVRCCTQASTTRRAR
ncbi:MAG TPA: FAD-dependent oxidoreductase [Chloroflexota bacterium]